MSETIDQTPPAEIKDLNAVVAVAPDLRLKIRAAEDALTIAQTMVIADNDDYQFVIDERNANLRTFDFLKAEMDKVLNPTKTIVDTVRGWFRPGITNTEAAIKHQNKLIGDYAAKLKREAEEAEQKRIEEERRVRQEAERVAAEAKARADAQVAEQRRIADEAAKDQARAIAAGNAKAAEEAAAVAARAIEAAVHAVETGNAAAEAATMQAAATINRPAPVAPTVVGNQMRERFVAELAANTTAEQAKLLILKAIVNDNDTALLGLVEIDQKALNQLAKSLKKNMKVPGYLAVDRPISAGSRK